MTRGIGWYVHHQGAGHLQRARIVASALPRPCTILGTLTGFDTAGLDILNLPDDVTVRIRPRADGARIDVRSASRLGGRDFGSNADRIRAYLDDVANLALAVK